MRGSSPARLVTIHGAEWRVQGIGRAQQAQAAAARDLPACVGRWQIVCGARPLNSDRRQYAGRRRVLGQRAAGGHRQARDRERLQQMSAFGERIDERT